VIRTLEQAGAWIDEVGLALLFPKADVVLPSLWEQIDGAAESNWAVREPDGTFVRWSDEMAFMWRAKDELPAAGLACVGKHLARLAACVAPRLVSVLAAANGSEPEGLEERIVEAVEELGPSTGPALREATGLGKKDVDRAVASLHRKLVLTNAFLVEGDGSWGALAHDLVARKWRLPARLASRDAARRDLALLLLEAAGELTAADLAGAFSWPRREAAGVLERVGKGRDEEGFRIWTPR
jgi:DNA glycosylase AlkZ-like